MANSGTQVLLYTNMAVNMNGEKPLQNMMMNYSIHKGSFPNFIAPNSFLKFRQFFIQLFFMQEVGKYPKHSGSESLPLLRHCRDPMESQPSPRNIKILKIGDGYVIAAKLYHTYVGKQTVSVFVNILIDCVQLYYTYVGKQTVGVYVNILIDCVQLYYTYVGKQTVGVFVNILIECVHVQLFHT